MWGPLPSRDGKKIFFQGLQPKGELLRYDVKSRRFVPYLSGISAEGVSFSKDAEWMAYVTYPHKDLWRSRPNGIEQLRLTFSPLEAHAPQWSPDGKRIAFFARAPGANWKIYVVSAEGGTPREVLANEGTADPTWSPDGNSLMYSRMDDPKGIYTVNLITHRVSTIPGSKRLFSPRWSPDGRFVSALRSESQKLALFDLSAQTWRDLADVPAAFPNWSRDGKYIYFEGLESEPSIFRIRTSDRKLERVASLKEIRQTDGAWFSVAPDDSPVVVRDVGTQEIYSLDWESP
jgi:Tol biopolymer transport system component